MEVHHGSLSKVNIIQVIDLSIDNLTLSTFSHSMLCTLSISISLSLSCDDPHNVTMEIRFSPELLWCRRCHQLWDACGVSHMLFVRVSVSPSRGRADCILARASMRVVLFGTRSVLIKAVMHKYVLLG